MEEKKDKNVELFKEIDKKIALINSYPVLHNEEEKEKAKKWLIRVYKKGSENIKQSILYVIYNLIMKAGEYRISKEINYFNKINKERARLNVYKAMFDYCESIEGVADLLKLLSKFEDNASLKVISKVLTFSLANSPNDASLILRNACLDILGEHKNYYALRILLNIIKYSENDKLTTKCYIQIKKWENRKDKKVKEIIKKYIDDKIEKLSQYQ